MRNIVIGAAQMGPIQKAENRDAVVLRMVALLEQAHEAHCNLVVFPELALTTFFPRHYMEDQKEVDAWFEVEMPNASTQPLFDAAKRFSIALSFGYAELTPEGRHFNTSILTDNQANIIAKYRKVHLPGHTEYDPERDFQHLEKRYFEPGDLGFPVWQSQNAHMGMCICNDRRWPEVYRVMALQGAELIMLGYNTPATNSQQREFVVARASSEDDELLVHSCDMDQCNFGKATVFDFDRHRRIEHYGLITSQTGVVLEEQKR